MTAPNNLHLIFLYNSLHRIPLYNCYMQAFSGSHNAKLGSIEGRINKLVSDALISSENEETFIRKIEKTNIPPIFKEKARKHAALYFKTSIKQFTNAVNNSNSQPVRGL